MESSMELSDDQIMMKAWEVAKRRGWEFVINSLLRGGVDLGTRGLSGGGVARICGELKESSQLGKLSSVVKLDYDTVISQESSEEEEEEDGEEAAWDPGSVAERKGGSGWQDLVAHRKRTLSSKSLVGESDVVDPDLELRIKLFVSKATTAFSDCFSRKAITSELPPPSSSSSTEGSCMDAQTQTLLAFANQMTSPKFLQTSTLGPKVGQISSHLGDGTPSSGLLSEAVITPKTLTGSAEEFLWPVNLAAHVSKQLRQTVVALQFFDMFSLLPDCSEDTEPVSCRSISEWQKGFSIMGSILLEEAPAKMKGFFNYGDIIVKAHDAVQGEAWLTYDEEFRRLKAIHPDMSWAVIHSLLWLQLIPLAPAGLEAQNKSSPSGTCESSKVNVPNDQKLKRLCPRYNKGLCMGSFCNLAHRCLFCGAAHPKVMCPERGPPPLKKQQLE